MRNALLIILFSLFGFASVAYATSTFIVQQGGTGVQTLGASQVVTGNGTGPVYTTATTSATCSGSTTCTSFTILGSTPVTISSSGGAGTVTQINTTFPILGGPITTTGTLSFGGLSTTSPWTVGQLAEVASNSTLFSTPTSTVTCAGTTSCGSTSFILGSALTITGTGLASYDAFTHPAYGGSATSSLLTLTGGLLVNNASSTIVGNVNIVGNATTSQATTTNLYFSGEAVGTDVANSWTGRISPTHSFVLGTATTTGWTASTTNSAYSPFLVMPFAGTLRQTRCLTDQSFVGVNVQVNGSNVTPSYFVASTTVGVEKFTTGNTFTAGQKILVNFGTTTTSATTQVNCTFDVTETP